MRHEVGARPFRADGEDGGILPLRLRGRRGGEKKDGQANAGDHEGGLKALRQARLNLGSSRVRSDRQRFGGRPGEQARSTGCRAALWSR
jgi:hypothetical protein